MKVSEQHFQRTAARAGLSPAQADLFWRELQINDTAEARFEPAHVGYYFGALLVIGAMGWFMTKGWDAFTGWQLSAISTGYAAVFLLVGNYLWKHPLFKIVGGLLVTMAVCMAPLAIYGIERQFHLWPASDPGSYTHFHPYIHASWVAMELGTIAAGLIALRFFPFPFLTAPITYALWYMSMDATALIFGREWQWKEECIISATLGMLLLLISFFVDQKTELDFSFWGYLFGLLMFTGGLSLVESGSQLGKFVYFLVHLAFIVIATLLRRKAFLVFGGFGVFGYLCNEAYTYFRNSVAFPFVLTIIGLLLIYAATRYKKNEERLQARFPALKARRARA